MEEDTVVRLPRPGASVADDPLLEVLRSGTRRMLQQVIEAEVEAFLAAHAELEDAHGRRRVVRPVGFADITPWDRAEPDGHAPEREIQTGIGPIAVRRPKLRDRGDSAGSARIRFTSKVLPPFLRRTRNVEELLPSGLGPIPRRPDPPAARSPGGPIPRRPDPPAGCQRS
jgi:putative transposase